MIENLTGHAISLVTEQGDILCVIPPSTREEPIRASYREVYKEEYNNIPLSKSYYFLETSQEKLDEIYFKYKSIVVSKISAEALRKAGYKGTIYITGKKIYKEGKLIGVKSLSEY